jgi:anti-sigma regulatory factor (Ser/Thr protein kinase)
MVERAQPGCVVEGGFSAAAPPDDVVAVDGGRPMDGAGRRSICASTREWMAADEAFDALVRLSQELHRRLRGVAQLLVALQRLCPPLCVRYKLANGAMMNFCPRSGLDADHLDLQRRGVMVEPVVRIGSGRELRLTYPPSESVAGSARNAVAEFCRAVNHGALADDAALLTSELMTNACRHAHATVSLRASNNESAVMVEVSDDDSADRPLGATGVNRGGESGRGLMLVAAIADSWGTDLVPGGKSVWFRLS